MQLLLERQVLVTEVEAAVLGLQAQLQVAALELLA
jgi:hypothetical protein